jgi:hypothetical protein
MYLFILEVSRVDVGDADNFLLVIEIVIAKRL